jgi:TetR/AcrR family transcriptional regulator, copper-responsive repressor
MKSGRPRSFDTAEVLSAAMAVFWRHGYEGASLTQLQAATGLTPPSIYNAFGSKEGLYLACLEHYATGPGALPVAPLREDPPSRAGAREFLLTAAREFTQPDRPKGCMISTAALNLGRDLTSVGAAPARYRAATMAMVTDYLRRAQEAGTLAASVDPAALARHFGATIQGMSVQACDGATQEELAEVAELALTAWP